MDISGPYAMNVIFIILEDKVVMDLIKINVKFVNLITL